MRKASSAGLPFGSGVVEFSALGGNTMVTRAEARNPLKLLAPRRRTSVGWLYASTFGGGILGGDQIGLEVHLRENTTGVLSTQSATKVYKSHIGIPSRQTLRITLEENAVLVVVPDPLMCFAGADYEQSLQCDLHPGSHLVLVDWLSSGRWARGERWAFSRYRSRTEIHRDGKPVLCESLLLDPRHGRLDGPHRLADFNCLATVTILGERFRSLSHGLLENVQSQPIEPGASLIEAASPLAEGTIWRLMGRTPEQVGHRLKQRMHCLHEHLGETPWARKW